MENITFNSREEFKKYIEEHQVKRFGVGEDGYCVLLDNGLVIKCFHYDYYPEYVLQFKDVDTDTFIFAKSCALVNGFAAGAFMQQAVGETVYDHKPVNQNFITLGEHLDVLMKDTKLISEKGILIKDFKCSSLIYDDKRFRVVDTIRYESYPKSDLSIPNTREVMHQIYPFLLNEIMSYHEIRREYSFWGRLDRLEKPKEYFEEIKDRIEEVSGEKITTLADANKVLSKVYKQ